MKNFFFVENRKSQKITLTGYSQNACVRACVCVCVCVCVLKQ